MRYGFLCVLRYQKKRRVQGIHSCPKPGLEEEERVYGLTGLPRVTFESGMSQNDPLARLEEEERAHQSYRPKMNTT